MRRATFSARRVLAALGCVAFACTPGERDEEERTGVAEAALGQPFGGETEPNGAAAQATPIGDDVVVRANVYANGDQDY